MSDGFTVEEIARSERLAWARAHIGEVLDQNAALRATVEAAQRRCNDLALAADEARRERDAALERVKYIEAVDDEWAKSTLWEQARADAAERERDAWRADAAAQREMHEITILQHDATAKERDAALTEVERLRGERNRSVGDLTTAYTAIRAALSELSQPKPEVMKAQEMLMHGGA